MNESRMQSSKNRAGRRDWKRFPLSGLSALCAVIVACLLPATGALQRFEWFFQDSLQRTHPPKSSTFPVVFVEVQDSTLMLWSEPGVFWGGRFAKALEEIHRLGAKQIGFDFILASSPDAFVRRELNDSLSSLKLPGDSGERVLSGLPESLRPNETFVNALENLEGRITLADDPIFQNETLTLFRTTYDASIRHMGFVQLPEDSDGVVRSAPLYTKIDGETAPAFSAMIAARTRGRDTFDKSSLLQLAGKTEGAGDDSRYMIRYRSDFEKTDSAGRVLHIAIEKVIGNTLTPEEKARFKGAVVLVGATYQNSQDVHNTPLRPNMSGLSIQANALLTLLDGGSPQTLSKNRIVLLTVAIALLSFCFAVTTPFPVSISGAAVCAIGYWFLFETVFAQYSIFLPLAYPLCGLALPLFSCQLVRALEEKKFRQDVESLFGRSVTPQIRDYLLADPTSLNLGGSRVEATALFLDMRGSTAFAEAMAPEAVFEELNALYAVLVPVIEKNGGLVNKFLGDGFLAVFGAPIPLENHAGSAVAAALEIVKTIDVFNQNRAGSGKRLWRLGCGIHTGALAYGNLGDARRADFTVIGDTINLAARIETWNKKQGSVIALSASTAKYLKSIEPFLGPVAIEVEGRGEQTLIYYLPQPTSER